MKHIKEFLADALSDTEEIAKSGKEAGRTRVERMAAAEENERRAVADNVEQGRQS